MADKVDPKADPKGPSSEEFEPFDIGELIDSVVDRTSKAWAKTFADLLDVGAGSSEGDPPVGGDPPADPPPADPPAADPPKRRPLKFL